MQNFSAQGNNFDIGTGTFHPQNLGIDLVELAQAAFLWALVAEGWAMGEKL